MKVTFDPEAHALYIAITSGQVAETIELEEGVYVDVDVRRTPLGIEFVNADDFVPFLEKHQGDLDLFLDVHGLIERKTA